MTLLLLHGLVLGWLPRYKDQAYLPSLPEIAENNVLDLEQNANGSEVLQE